MLLLNKTLFYVGSVLILFYLVIIIINKQFSTIPQVLMVAVVFTVLMLYWKSTILMDIEDEKEKEKLRKGEIDNEEKDMA